ncbi:MAG: TetR/AcrR family transcriptional regulator [Burkholderiales bacterium]|nr:TetR/AcrR family transcriptional regulator [Burkholderiales bacterium]
MKTDLAGPAPRWARRKQARPAELLAAALDVFVERGFAATRLDDIALRAGVTKGTLYLYYDSKEDLLKAVVRAGMVPVVREAEAMVAHFTGSTAELMRNLAAVWWNAIGATRLSGIPKLVIAEAGNFPEVARLYHDEVIRPVSELIGRLLQRGMDSGEFRSVDADYMQRIAMAPLVMLNLWMHSFSRYDAYALDPPRYLAAYLDILLAGLAPRSETQGNRSCR